MEYDLILPQKLGTQVDKIKTCKSSIDLIDKNMALGIN